MWIKEKFLKLMLVLLALFCASVTPIMFAEEVSASQNSYENEVLKLVNEERKKVGIAPLEMDRELLSAAKTRAKELETRFSHTRPDGSSCYSVSPKVRGENIAYGQQTPQKVMDSWMNSPSHRENILNPKFKSIGIGYHKGNHPYWVQLFGVEKADDGSPTISRPGKPSVSLTTGNKKIVVKWKRIPNASGYQIYTSTKKNGNYVLKKTITKGDTLQYTDNNLKRIKHYYKVRSYIRNKERTIYGAFSSVKSKTPK